MKNDDFIENYDYETSPMIELDNFFSCCRDSRIGDFAFRQIKRITYSYDKKISALQKQIEELKAELSTVNNQSLDPL